MKQFNIWGLTFTHRPHLIWALALAAFLFLPHTELMAQMDQGIIGGVVEDSTGAVVPGAQVTLMNTDTGITFQSEANASGIYTFPSTKVGNYKVTVSAAGFRTLTQENIHLNVQAHLNIKLVLQPGAVSQTVTVTSAPPLLQTQDASVGQVMSTDTIDHTPLNGRNWVYIAQLAPGAVPANGSRGAGKGDFNANGQRAEQNNFILNGIDNNSYALDFMNGSSYAVQPPPDALSEFKIQTADFSAQFGHSAGAVVNASIKSGTNRFHGDLYEYLRNDALNARNWGALTNPKYRENQFGATLGGPIIRDKVFFFGYAEANRVVFGSTFTESVPSALMRQGNFSELLTPSLNSSGVAIHLYEPGSAGQKPLTCNGEANVMCPNQVNPIAQNLLNHYPLPNANGGKLYNNYIVNENDLDNTWQWGGRLDWNVSPRDQAFLSYSYSNEIGSFPPPLGPIIDSGAYGADGQNNNLTETAALSETHLFSPKFYNEFRFGYSYGKFAFLQVNPNNDTSAHLGLGGIPFNSVGLGGLPLGTVSGISAFGPSNFNPAEKGESVFNVLDSVTKISGNHSLGFGFYLSAARLPYLVSSNSRGSYTYNGRFTSIPGQANTGSGVADLLFDQMFTSTIALNQKFYLATTTWAGYAEDNWRVTHNLTLNLGVRYNYSQPVYNTNNLSANLVLTAPITPGSSAGTFFYTNKVKGQFLSPIFTNALAASNIGIDYSGNRYLANPGHYNFAPRIGFAYQPDPVTVVRGGFGTFYGGLNSAGLQKNYPFQFSSNFVTSAPCVPGSCPADGITLAQGFTQQLAVGLVNAPATPALQSLQTNIKEQSSSSFNLTVERSLARNLTATFGYVGSVGRHLEIQYNRNAAAALTDPRLSAQAAEPFPLLGANTYNNFGAESSYNSLQAKLNKRFASGLNFLATYTWAHSLDDALPLLGSTGDSGYRAPILIGISPDYSNSAWDTRNRATFNGYYELPFGRRQRFLNHSAFADVLLGGWATDLQFTAQSGFPFTVSNTSAAGSAASPNGATSEAIMVRNPFGFGGSADPSNPKVTCAARTRTTQHWYNPCAFANPPAAFPSASVPGSPISKDKILGLAALPYLGGRRLSVPGPGYERINMSAFKRFSMFREQYLEFRADVFNLLNTPAYAIPSVSNDGSNGGQITGTRFFQNLTPDARFFQVSAKYVF